MWKGPNILRVSASFVRLRRTFIFYCTESENGNTFYPEHRQSFKKRGQTEVKTTENMFYHIVLSWYQRKKLSRERILCNSPQTFWLKVCLWTNRRRNNVLTRKMPAVCFCIIFCSTRQLQIETVNLELLCRRTSCSAFPDCACKMLEGCSLECQKIAKKLPKIQKVAT